jgi:hypothetical protein
MNGLLGEGLYGDREILGEGFEGIYSLFSPNMRNN